MLNSYTYLLKKSWFYLKVKRKRFLKAHILIIISALIEFNKPIFIALAINSFESNHPTPVKNSIFWVSMFFFSQLVVWIFFNPANIEKRKLAFEIGKTYRENIFNKLIDRPLHWHKKFHSGELSDKAKKSSEALQTFFYNGFEMLRVITIFAISAVVIIYFTNFLGILISLACLTTIQISSYFDKKVHKQSLKINNKTHKMSGYFQDYLSNLITIISLRLQKFTQTKIKQTIKDIYPPYYKKIITLQKKWFFTDITINFITATTIISYIYLNYGKPSFSIAALAALIGYTFNLTEAIYSFTYSYEEIIEQHADLMSGEEIINQKSQNKSNQKQKIKKWNKIEIKNLNFTYKDEKRTIKHLKNINFTLEPSKKIAFVGESGSGKSTFLKILGGLEWSESVEIKINKKTFANTLAIDHLSTLIPQDAEIFNNTIGYNINLGQSTSDKEMTELTKISRFYKVLKKLPNGLNTHIKEKGVNLSGGQKQRLALTRGLLAAKNSSIILLDEPTSSIDPENEIEIYKNIFKKFKNACIISSVHKPYLLELFDQVYNFSEGKLTIKQSK